MNKIKKCLLFLHLGASPEYLHSYERKNHIKTDS